MAQRFSCSTAFRLQFIEEGKIAADADSGSRTISNWTEPGSCCFRKTKSRPSMPMSDSFCEELLTKCFPLDKYAPVGTSGHGETIPAATWPDGSNATRSASGG